MDTRKTPRPVYPLLLLLLLIPLTRVSAQSAALTLPQVVQTAVEKYPATQAALEQAAAAAAGIELARTAYLPRIDLLGQINRATRNNVFGLLLPQSVIPSISGPVLGSNEFTSVWGSAAGALVSWEPVDFGLRQAAVQNAETTRRKADAGILRTRLEISSAAADAFLSLLAADQMLLAAYAGLERARKTQQVVDALVQAELRPGADAARSRAEVARAETQRIQAEQAVDIARASLAQWLGGAPQEISAASGPFLDLPPAPEEASAKSEEHPVAREQQAAVDEVRAREALLARSYFPRFNLQAAGYLRGTGARVNGSTGGGFSGWAPDTQNWALGLTVTFPLLELPSLRARRSVEMHRERAETARYAQLLQDLNSRQERARAVLQAARLIARQLPAQLDAARAAEQQARARYNSGLGTLLELADAERLLTQSEIDSSLAHLNVWRALLSSAVARGDLEPFLRLASR